jgi:hypothetical protein
MNLKVLILLLLGGFALITFAPFGSPALTAITYLLPFFLYVIYVNLFPPYFGSLSNEEKEIINVEKWNSILRSIIQVVGSLVALSAFGLNVPYIDIIDELLNFVSGNFEEVVAAIKLIIGFGISIYGFFRNDERFQSRLTAGKRLK